MGSVGLRSLPSSPVKKGRLTVCLKQPTARKMTREPKVKSRREEEEENKRSVESERLNDQRVSTLFLSLIYHYDLSLSPSLSSFLLPTLEAPASPLPAKTVRPLAAIFCSCVSICSIYAQLPYLEKKLSAGPVPVEDEHIIGKYHITGRDMCL